ncbi:MAG: hypothetical protein ACLUOI_27810 [Eisenbergiella sp.]
MSAIVLAALAVIITGCGSGHGDLRFGAGRNKGTEEGSSGGGGKQN